jgi:hypothetical protein
MFPDDNAARLELAGLFAGSLVGFTAGYVAGYFARRGSTVAKAASIVLYVLAGTMVGFQAQESWRDLGNWNWTLSGWGW